MPTYSKETALYDTGKISTDITAAGQTADRYITAVDQNGIKVHAESNPTTNYTKIDANGMEVYQNVNSTATKVASFGSSGAQIGQSGAAHSVIDANGHKFYGSDGTTLLANIGYSQYSGGGTTFSPIYTFGTRSSNLSTDLGYYSMAQGRGVTASGDASHAEGINTQAISSAAHAEGSGTIAGTNAIDGWSSHAEGNHTEASGSCSHAEGQYCTASGEFSHAQGEFTIAAKNAQTSLGTYNVEDSATTTTHPSGDTEYGTYAVIVGNGEFESPSNALTVDWGGNVQAAGAVTVKGHSSPIGSRLSAVWTASSSSASGTAMTGDITLTPGVWMLGMITPTCSATKAYYFSNISSSLSYPYFTMGTGGSGWVPVEITTSTTTHVTSGASTACNYSNLTRGRILAVRIA